MSRFGRLASGPRTLVARCSTTGFGAARTRARDGRLDEARAMSAPSAHTRRPCSRKASGGTGYAQRSARSSVPSSCSSVSMGTGDQSACSASGSSAGCSWKMATTVCQLRGDVQCARLGPLRRRLGLRHRSGLLEHVAEHALSLVEERDVRGILVEHDVEADDGVFVEATGRRGAVGAGGSARGRDERGHTWSSSAPTPWRPISWYIASSEDSSDTIALGRPAHRARARESDDDLDNHESSWRVPRPPPHVMSSTPTLPGAPSRDASPAETKGAPTASVGLHTRVRHRAAASGPRRRADDASCTRALSPSPPNASLRTCGSRDRASRRRPRRRTRAARPRACHAW